MELASLRRGLYALAFSFATGLAAAQEPARLPPAHDVETALADMHAWVGSGENGRRWRSYLLSARLEEQLARGQDADAEALTMPLSRYRSGAPGLELPRFQRVEHALASWQQSLQAEQTTDLAALARAAAGQFKPIAAGQAAAAREDLRQNVAELDRYLSGQGANGENWKDYLRLDELQEQLMSDAPDVAALARVYRQFRAIHEGLEFPVFANVANSLEKYINVANMRRAADQAGQYARQLELLAEEIAAYQAEASQQRRFSLARRLGFVASLGQAPRMVEAVRRRFARPNLHARISEELLAAATVQPVRDVRPVTDVILGTYITGTAITDGRLYARTVPSGRGPGQIELVLSGVVSSDTVGRNGPVCIYSTGQTPFSSLKTLYFDELGFRELPACTDATTCTNIHCIVPVKGGLGSRLVQRIAWKRAGQQKPQAEAIASQRAEGRISGSFNSRTADLLAEAHANYNRNFRLPLIRRNEFPEYFNVRTTDDALFLTLLQATPYQLGAVTPAPQPRDSHDLSVVMHETLPNNLAQSLLSGFHLTDDWLRERIRRRGGEIPEELEADQEPWSITFDELSPVSVDFGDDGFTVTIRGQRFTSGENAYGAMNITARYQVVADERGLLLQRQGDLEILPPGFQPGVDRLSAEQSALREILTERLGEVFEPEVRAEGIELPGELARAGRLLPVLATSNDGWLVIGWNRGGQPSEVAMDTDNRGDDQRGRVDVSPISWTD